MTAPDVLSLVSTVGGGFRPGALAGYALKKVMKIAAVIVGLFIAALAYLEYQQIISVDWEKLQLACITKCNYNVLKYTHTSIE